MERREFRGEDEPRYPATAAEIEHRTWGYRRTYDRGEGPCMCHVVVDRPRPEEAEAPRLAENVEECNQDSGRITTYRRGSSPSDVVLTPSMEFAVSWTTLRSAADIGSSARRCPLDTTI